MTLTRREWLAQGDFTLVLSAGFFGFFAHTGLLQALEQHALAPRRIVGVSAGALAGGLWASGLPAGSIAEALLSLRREEFWDPGLPLGGLLAGRKFFRKLQDVLAPTGVEAFEDCPIPFTAVAFDLLQRKAQPLATGPLHSGIVASCTVPLMFRPIWRDGRLLVDGGVSDRAGRSAWDPQERALVHFFPSRRKVGPGRGESGVKGANLAWLVTPDLPAVHPYALGRGRVALERARCFAQHWLEESMEPHPPGFQTVGKSVYSPSR